MAQPNYIQTIPITANIQPFRGFKADGELHFQPGYDVCTWLDSVEAYYVAAAITKDVEKIARISTDRSCGDPAVVVARTSSEFVSRTWAALREALISHYSDYEITDPLTLGNGTIHEDQSSHKKHTAVAHGAIEDQEEGGLPGRFLCKFTCFKSDPGSPNPRSKEDSQEICLYYNNLCIDSP